MSASGLERHMLKLPVSLQRTDGTPWTTGNKQRGLMRFRFHPSGIVARAYYGSVWVIQAREAELERDGVRQSDRGLRVPSVVRGL